MIFPSVETAKELLKSYKTVPVFYELLIDSCTPVRIFRAMKQHYENCFILESVDNSDRWGRYSFIGIDPKTEIRIKNGEGEIIRSGETEAVKVDNPIELLQKILAENTAPKFPNRPKLTGGLVGYFAYDCVRYFEKTLKNPPKDDLDMPDANLFLYDEIVAYDHLSNKAVIILNIRAEESDIEAKYRELEQKASQIGRVIAEYVPEEAASKGETSEPIFTSNVTKEEYIEMVEKCKEHIVNGDISQVVVSQRFETENPPEPFDVYRMLRSTNPSPYLYYFDHKDYCVAGASPEMLVNVTDRAVTTKPIAGTVPRGATEAEDEALKKQLLADEKERAEHTMLVDLGRNDVGRVCRFGTVEVTDYMRVETYSKVTHLVSDVHGELAEGKTALDALMSVLPAGTLSGAPKVRAMEIIDSLEKNRRGLYGGTVGYLAFDGDIDACIAIRTVLFRNGKAYVQAGAGIVYDSVPEKEYEETKNKALAVINAVKEAAKL